MLNSKKMALVSFLVVAGLIYWGFHFKREGNELTQAPSAPSAQIQPKTTTTPVSSVATLPSAEKIASPKDQVAKPPLISKLREEVKLDVHSTPPSLLRFGADMGVRMKDAKRSRTEAVSLLGELKTCTKPAEMAESPVQARALCLVSARELEKVWPDLSDEIEALVQNSDPMAIQLASKLHGFSK